MVLEGLHAVKHALRFGATIVELVAVDPGEVADLASDLAPDAASLLRHRSRQMSPADFETIVRSPLPDGRVLALARRPADRVGAVMAEPAGSDPVVLLDHPRHLGNVGAAIRVAAAAGAQALAVTGTADPWHPNAVRGAAGLQFALAVGRIDSLEDVARPIVALDPDGEPLRPEHVPPGAVLAFGSERRGLGEHVRRAATTTVALPMRHGVSSINLAAAVAAVLYALRLR